MTSKKEYHAWVSNEMYAFTGTIYTWKNADNALIRTTIVSDSSSSPMLNSDRSRYKDFKYMGPVIEWMRTDPLPIWGLPAVVHGAPMNKGTATYPIPHTSAHR